MGTIQDSIRKQFNTGIPCRAYIGRVSHVICNGLYFFVNILILVILIWKESSLCLSINRKRKKELANGSIEI